MQAEPPIARTLTGRVQGVSLGAVNAFLGIPYAAAPLGELRWRSPQPVTPWTDLRMATDFGACAWQALAPGGFGPWTSEFVVSGPISEDCLFLNVWSPSERAGSPRPVLVWIHGGAFLQGSGSVPIYDGRALAEQDVIVVTINYRLGVLGFLAHPELADESDTPQGYGNFGLQDQIAALRWVQSNISSFGGDPGTVTVAGQSAGALSVHMLVASPSAAGLFQRAIALSGPPELMTLPSRAQAEATGLAFAAALQHPDLEGLRALSVEALTQNLGPGPQFWPMVDGHLLPAWPPYAPHATGTAHATWGRPVPMIVGQTADENSGLDPSYDAASAAYRQAALERWLAALWCWSARRGDVAAAPVYACLFDHVMPGAQADRYGAFHTSDVPYALANLSALVQRPLSAVDLQLSSLVSGYWLDFMRTGDPNGSRRPLWPSLDPASPRLLRLASQTEAMPMFSPDRVAALHERLQEAGSFTVLG